MAFPYYVGQGERRKKPLALPVAPVEKLHHGSNYLPDDGLRDAANVALLLGRPLLLTGEPGTGKTDFAASLAWELGYGPPLKFETKSSSTARDLFYVYDTLGRFHAAHSETGEKESREYITYAALGLAIIRTKPVIEVEHVIPTSRGRTGKPEFAVHPGTPERSVVLIDEVDKAPRDFPNDVLNELERMFFRIPELGNERIEADQALRPIVVITSNSERHLPGPFLRRCVYYHLPFPEEKRLREIVELRLGEFGIGNLLLSDALDFFYLLRAPTSPLGEKKPATAEFLDWLIALRGAGAQEDAALHHQPALVASTLGALVKEEASSGMAALRDWIKNKAAGAPPEVRPTLEAWLDKTARR